MYIPPAFNIMAPEVLREHMQSYPLATLIIHNSEQEIDAHHIPLIWNESSSTHGTLSGHVSINNSLWKQCIANTTPVLAIFHGPHSYISPSWYPSKKENGKAVPTWNYAVVHAHGILHAVTDLALIKKHLSQLSGRHEKNMPHPWQMRDAPESFIDTLARAVIGIKIEITHLQGKYKLSQNQPIDNREGVIESLQKTFAHNTLTPDTQALAIADLMKQKLNNTH